jgi:hypothetical protein
MPFIGLVLIWNNDRLVVGHSAYKKIEADHDQ